MAIIGDAGSTLPLKLPSNFPGIKKKRLLKQNTNTRRNLNPKEAAQKLLSF